MKNTLTQDLAEVINRHCKENDSNTPDFILAEYLENCLNIFAAASRKREAWYGKELRIGGVKEIVNERYPNIPQP